jgi:hypothetical protein
MVLVGGSNLNLFHSVVAAQGPMLPVLQARSSSMAMRIF